MKNTIKLSLDEKLNISKNVIKEEVCSG